VNVHSVPTSDINSNENVYTDSEPTTKAEDVARCENCFGYLNPYATFYNTKWKCPLCNNTNPFSQESKYSSMSSRAHLPECKEKFLELRADSDESASFGPGKSPIFIAVVDLTGNEQNLTYQRRITSVFTSFAS